MPKMGSQSQAEYRMMICAQWGIIRTIDGAFIDGH
ncbi:hypothetical protein BSS2_II0134 [Brucella suis bv. 1 str. S2]|uniref:Uncharacterized protein n=4 Tax=Brucella TaxID=234 RepID=Q2YLA9_BRUA2|nr:hypothetical protein BRA0140 [Brucella suis 1330]AAX75583.1 hypothetical protein BruAb2_0137 [Brucella abortus bv. 1 str. 9-941]ACU49276.1 hypothetical protein BMI_II139 [Brucella microti CCM 4915]AEK55597.1 hypothetical protein BPI_II139 [Brucella pinnipedialis B2/94]AEU07297.1 hypothetical protein BSVBI22_B0139 [Brucella suis VBI22]AHN47898.1 hypothetical protein BSS2_II0134 [Brucella suis bv. 1 str. S2]CAJ12303.1 conserved hypothetical protein [Brucella abortus 2308]CDL77692.1 unnamed 